MIAAFTAGNPVLKPRFRIPFCFLRWSPKTGWFLDGVRTPCGEIWLERRILWCNNTVDGRNPAPVDMINIPSIYVFFKKSQVVVWDFFYQLRMIEVSGKFSKWSKESSRICFWAPLGCFLDIILRSINRTNGPNPYPFEALESIGIEGKQR